MTESAKRTDTVAGRRATALSEQRAAKRRRIVEAAAQVIETHGTNAAIGLVADAAGIPRPHVYRYFEGKEELDREVARHAARSLAAALRPTLTAPATTPREVVHRPIAVAVNWAHQNPNLFRFRTRHRVRYTFSEILDAAITQLRSVGHDIVPPAQTVAAVIGLAEASLLWWLDKCDEGDPSALSAAELTDRLTAQVTIVLDDMLRELGVDL